MNRWPLYVEQQLSTGLVLCEPSIAYRLRRDLWTTPIACRAEFGHQRLKKLIEERAPILFTFTGDSYLEGFGAAFAGDAKRLEERIADLYGLSLRITIVERFKQPVRGLDMTITKAQDRKRERLAELRELAEEELPSHDCPLRREILAAQQELARLEPHKS